MTKEEILELEPGREIDCLIAEKIMGWKVIEGSYINSVYIVGDDDYKEIGSCNFSTDISAAWEVVEKMKELHYDTAELYRFTDNKWLVKFVCSYGPCPYHNNPENTWHGSSVTAQTAPEAICKAALLAVQEVMNKK